MSAQPAGMGGQGRRWAAGLAALAALAVWPVFLWWSYGDMVPLPQLPSWQEVQAFFGSIDDYALGQLVARTALRLGWTLWFYFVFVLVFSLVAQVLERRRPTALRDVVDAQPRFVLAFVNAIVLLVLAAPGPRGHNPGLVRDVPVSFVSSADASNAPRSGPLQATPTQERVVERLDTLSSIARDLLGAASAADPRVPKLVDEIVALNRGHEVAPGRQLTNPDKIMPGWRLLVPAGTVTPGTVTAATASMSLGGPERVVRSGDTLTAIAQELLGGASTQDPRVPKLVDEIVALNRGHEVAPGRRLTDPNRIMAGWRLRIPQAPVSGAVLAARPPATAPPAGPIVAPQAPVVVRIDPPPPATASASASASAAAARPGGAPGALEGARPPAAPEPDAAREESSHGVRVPGGPLVPVALAGALLAAAIRARTERLRKWRPGQAPVPEAPESPVVEASRAADVVPTFDLVGPFAEVVLEAWHEATGEVPRIEAAWERADSVSFLLSAQGTPRRMEVDDPTTGIRVRFSREPDGTTRAHASGPRLPSLRHSLVAMADGLLVPVGYRAEGALHVPLLGAAVSVAGPGAERLVETALLTAGLRARSEELRIVAVGDVPPLLTGLDPLGDLEVPALERVDRAGEPALREELEAELVRRARRIGERGGEDLLEYALVRPDDRLQVVILVVDERVAGEWRALLAQGARWGIACLILGSETGVSEDAGCRLVLGADHLSVATAYLGEELTVTPYLLAREVLEPDAATADAPSSDASSSDVLSSTDEPSPAAARPAAAVPVAPPAPSSRPMPRPSARTYGAARRSVPEQPYVSVVLFGDEVRVLRGGRDSPTPPDRDKARELVAYLAGCPDGATPEQLCAVLWPDRGTGDGTRQGGQKNVKGSLSVSISHARRWLEAGTTNPPDLLPLLGDRYRLAFQFVWVDVAVFEEAIREARASSDPEPALRRALELYGGDLCQGLDRTAKRKGSSEQFLWVEKDGIRWDLRKDAVWAADRLAAVLLDRQQPEAALEVLEPLLTTGPVSEALECRAMECHAALRDRESVHRRWVRLQSRLVEEFDVEPLPETAALYRDLMGRPPAAQTA